MIRPLCVQAEDRFLREFFGGDAPHTLGKALRRNDPQARARMRVLGELLGKPADSRAARGHRDSRGPVFAPSRENAYARGRQRTRLEVLGERVDFDVKLFGHSFDDLMA
jgi:hypothetical protein